jgi:hypothetical protein
MTADCCGIEDLEVASLLPFDQLTLARYSKRKYHKKRLTDTAEWLPTPVESRKTALVLALLHPGALSFRPCREDDSTAFERTTESCTRQPESFLFNPALPDETCHTYFRHFFSFGFSQPPNCP